MTGRTWSPDTVYVASGDLSIAAGGRLAVLPGTVVKFALDKGLRVVGVLDARGTAVAPVVFTSLRDDSYGGDSNGDGGKSAPAAGDWRVIEYESSRPNTLAHCLVRYGGSSSQAVRSVGRVPAVVESTVVELSLGGGIQVAGTPVRVVDCVVRDFGAGPGIEVGSPGQAAISGNVVAVGLPAGAGIVFSGDGTAVVQGNSVRGPGSGRGDGIRIDGASDASRVAGNAVTGFGHAIRVSRSALEVSGNTIEHVNESAEWRYAYHISCRMPVIRGNTIDSHVLPAVAVSGAFAGEVTWVDIEGRGWPLVAVDDLAIADGSTLHLPTGTVVKLAAGKRFRVEGVLDAQGTAAAPVVFTSARDDSHGGDSNGDGGRSAAAAGDWLAIEFESSHANRLAHGLVLYGGGAGSCAVAWLGTAPAVVESTTVELSQGGGLRITGSSILVVGNTVRQWGAGAGIQGTSLGRARIGANTLAADRPGVDGIVFSGGGTAVVEANSVLGPGSGCGSGVWLEGASDASRVTGNTIKDFGYAVRVSGGGLEIAGNTIEHGSESEPCRYAWLLSKGVPVVRGNTIRGHILPAVAVGGALEGDVTWADIERRGWPFAAVDDLSIPAGSILHLPSSTVLKFAAGRRLLVEGILDAQGTEAAPVVMTSWRDDSHGGDSNGDGERSAPAAGDWTVLEYRASRSNVLAYCLVRYGGGGGGGGGAEPFMVSSTGPAPVEIRDSSLEHSKGGGIRVDGRTVQVADNVLRDVGGGGGITVTSSDQAVIRANLVEIAHQGANGIMFSGAATFAIRANAVRGPGQGGGIGVSVTGGGPSSSVTGNTVSGFRIGASIGSPRAWATSVSYNNFAGNGFGLENAGSGILVAENNWWGHPSGPAHPENAAGAGDSVSSRVDYEPWLARER